jgi:hypothetical protein
MDIRVDTKTLQGAVEEILREYGDVVYNATNEGLGAAEKVLVENLKAASPRKTGKFAKAWKGSGKKYKLMRFVGNTTTVNGKKGEVPLSNILEFSTTRGKPFIGKTYAASVEAMATAVIAEIKKEV